MTLTPLESLDNFGEKDFYELVEITAQLCNCPISLIAIIDNDSWRFLSKKGLGLQETAGITEFCSSAIKDGNFLEIGDASKDERFQSNPLMLGNEKVRFFAAAALVAKDGHKMGCICVADRKPRKLSKTQQSSLETLGTHVVRFLELHKTKSNPNENRSTKRNNTIQSPEAKIEDKLIREKDLSDQIINSLPGIFYLNDSTPKLLRWNKALETVTGYSGEELRKIEPTKLFDQVTQAQVRQEMLNTFATGKGAVECVVQSKTGEKYDYYFTGVRIEYEGKPAVLGAGIDISESKRKSKELSANREFLQAIIRNLPGYFYRVKNDQNYTPIYISEGVTKITGYEVREYLVDRTITCGAEIVPEHQDIVWDIVQSAIKQKKTYEATYQICTKKGELKWLWERGNGLWNEKGELILLEGFVTDISNQKRIELELAAKEERLKTVLTTEPECIKMLNRNGELLEMNPAGLAMIEADSEDQVRGMQVLKLVNPSFRKSFADLTNRVFQGESGKLEFELTGIKGTRRWLSTNAVPFKNSEGEIVALLAVTADITERKKVEESLINAEQRYRNIFENASEGIYQSTPAGEFLTVNNSFAKIFGYRSPAELIANLRNIETQLFVDSKDRLRLLRLFSTQDSITGFEMKARKKNGDIIWVRDNMHAIRDEEGQIMYLEGTLQDITERVNSRKKLEMQFDELKKMNYELDHFVYSVSHDLRAPLTSLMGLIEIANLEKPGKEISKYLQLMRDSVVRLDGFIHDILDYSRNTRIPIGKEKINFKAIIDNTARNLEHISKTRPLDITVDIKKKVPFYSDRLRIEIVFGNLISNAIKYQDKNKDSARLEIKVDITKKKAKIRLKDNGVGIEKAHLSKVDSMFYRASTLSNGSGLGLYIAKETIAKLGGSIKIESEVGKYTAISFSIPQLESSGT